VGRWQNPRRERFSNCFLLAPLAAAEVAAKDFGDKPYGKSETFRMCLRRGLCRKTPKFSWRTLKQTRHWLFVIILL
jgi:hypothetical protein